MSRWFMLCKWVLCVCLIGCDVSGGDGRGSNRSMGVITLSPAEQDVLAGQKQSRLCAGCHGPQGISRVSSYPSLAGRSAEYIQQQLLAFKSGERDNPIMQNIAANLTPEQMRQISRYYAQLPGAIE